MTRTGDGCFHHASTGVTRCRENASGTVDELTEHLHPRRVEAGLFAGFADGGRDGSVVVGIDASTGEGDLTGVRSQRRRARQQQHVEIA